MWECMAHLSSHPCQSGAHNDGASPAVMGTHKSTGCHFTLQIFTSRWHIYKLRCPPATVVSLLLFSSFRFRRSISRTKAALARRHLYDTRLGVHPKCTQFVGIRPGIIMLRDKLNFPKISR